MRHLLFIIGLLTTASTGQDKPTGPLLVPQSVPATKKPSESGPTLPPLPAPKIPEEVPATKPVTPTLTKVELHAEDLKSLQRLQLQRYAKQIFTKGRQADQIELRRGELKAIIKIASGVLPHQHGRDFTYNPSQDANGYVIEVNDKELNINIARVEFQANGDFKQLLVNKENLKKLSDLQPVSPYAAWKLSPVDERLASMAKHFIGRENYPSASVAGEFQLLMRASLLGNRSDLLYRPVYTEHEPKTLQAYFYHVLVLRDVQTREVRGVIGFFHSNEKDYPLVDYITMTGAKATPDEIAEVFYKRFNIQK